jgi:hypothetical protein
MRFCMNKHFLSFSLFAIFLPLNISVAQDYGMQGLGSGLYGMSKLDSTYPGFDIATRSYGSNNFAPKYVLPTSVGDCHSTQLNFDPKTIPFAMAGAKISGLASCADVKTTAYNDRFTELYCKSAIECSKAKTGSDNPGLLESVTVPKYLGEDFASVTFAKNIVKMDKVEALRKFAEKKYGKEVARNCKTPFDYDSDDASMTNSCDVRVLDNGFSRLQDSCPEMRTYCFNKVLDVKKDFKTFQTSFKPSGTESVTQAYFKDRSELLVNDVLANDSEMLGVLADIISSKDDSSTKMQNIFTKLGEYKKQGKLDPIFGFDKDYIDSSKDLYPKSVHFKFFEKLLQSKTLNLASAKQAIEDYRLSTAKNLLGATCLETPHVTSICQDATNLKKSKRISKFYNVGIATVIPEDKDDERFDILKGVYPTGVQYLDDYKAVMDAARCKAFNIVYVMDTRPTYESLYGSFLPDYDIASSYKFYTDDMPNKNSPSSQNLIKVVGKPNFSTYFVTNAAAGPIKPEETSETIKSSNEGTLSNSISEGFKDGYKETVKGLNVSDTANLASNSNLYNSSFNSVGRSYVESNDSIQKAADESALRDSKSLISNTNTALSDKIAELNKKLSSTEENLERIKADKEAADTEKERQRKISEENKTIADLKNQITEMKAESKTKVEDADSKNKISTIAATGINSSKEAQADSESSSGESRAPASVNKEQDANSGNANHSTSNSSGEAVSSASGSKPASSLQGGGSAGSSSAKSGVVLTKIDGMTSEKASEAITDKIIEMDGQPFYIEEGGMVKEIIPVIKNGKVILDEKGKPLFEKIVKGKVGDNKFARGKVQAKTGRVPASVTDTADLKRAEEERLKYERAEYIKLKEITKDLKLK